MKLATLVLVMLGLALPAAGAWAQSRDSDVLERARERDRERDRERERDDERSRVTYNGIGLSRISTEFENVKEAIALDATLGFRVPDVQWFGVELNLGFTIIPGEIEMSSTSTDAGSPTGCGVLGLEPCPPESRQTSSQEDFRALNLGVFAVIRTPGKLYGMGKLGYRYINSNLPELEEGRSGSAYGGGIGYRYSEAGGFAELQYTKISDQLDAVGFTLGYGFGGSD